MYPRIIFALALLLTPIVSRPMLSAARYAKKGFSTELLSPTRTRFTPKRFLTGVENDLLSSTKKDPKRTLLEELLQITARFELTAKSAKEINSKLIDRKEIQIKSLQAEIEHYETENKNITKCLEELQCRKSNLAMILAKLGNAVDDKPKYPQRIISDCPHARQLRQDDQESDSDLDPDLCPSCGKLNDLFSDSEYSSDGASD